jgi:hypothetical protein
MKRAAPPTVSPRRSIPPLPVDLARRVTAGLRSPRPVRKQQTIDALLAARAFAAGFVQGADSERARQRHVADLDDEHWLRGYDAGQRAAAEATARYLGDQLCRADPPGARPVTSSAPRAEVAARTPRFRRARAIRAVGALPSPQLTLLCEVLDVELP